MEKYLKQFVNKYLLNCNDSIENPLKKIENDGSCWYHSIGYASLNGYLEKTHPHTIWYIKKARIEICEKVIIQILKNKGLTNRQNPKIKGEIDFYEQMKTNMREWSTDKIEYASAVYTKKNLFIFRINKDDLIGNNTIDIIIPSFLKDTGITHDNTLFLIHILVNKKVQTKKVPKTIVEGKHFITFERNNETQPVKSNDSFIKLVNDFIEQYRSDPQSFYENLNEEFGVEKFGIRFDAFDYDLLFKLSQASSLPLVPLKQPQISNKLNVTFTASTDKIINAEIKEIMEQFRLTDEHYAEFISESHVAPKPSSPKAPPAKAPPAKLSAPKPSAPKPSAPKASEQSVKPNVRPKPNVRNTPNVRPKPNLRNAPPKNSINKKTIQNILEKIRKARQDTLKIAPNVKKVPSVRPRPNVRPKLRNAPSVRPKPNIKPETIKKIANNLREKLKSRRK